MKALKIGTVLIIIGCSMLSFSSCSKQDDDMSAVSKEHMLGKWDMIIQAGGSIPLQAVLKASGAMELDQPPYDGIPELILLWDVKDNQFTAHVDANGITSYWELHAPVDPKTLSMAGQIKVNDPGSPQTGLFIMDKK